MEHLIKKLIDRVAFAEKEGENMDDVSWGMQEGILISYNEAKVIIEALKISSNNCVSISSDLEDEHDEEFERANEPCPTCGDINDIYGIVNQIPRKEVDVDAVDAPSATTSIEQLISSYKIKAEKWDKLSEKIAKCYVDENGDELSEEDLEGIDLGTIGEIAASAFGWL